MSSNGALTLISVVPLAGLNPSDPLVATGTFSNGNAAEKAEALRALCAAQCGEQLFKLIYNTLSARSHSTGSAAYDDAYFRKELMNRLGPSRMQFVQLIAQLIYYDDCQK